MQLQDFEKALLRQQKTIDDLLTEVEDLRILRRGGDDAGDRIDYKFVDSIVFLQQENTAQNIVFTIPEETTVFYVERLSLYGEYRFVTTDPATDGPNEISYRPCIFSWYEGAFNPDIDTDSALGAIDAFLEIAETYYKNGVAINRSYQNMPMPTELLFSGAINFRQQGQFSGQFDSFEFPASFIFPCPYLLTGGSSITLKIAPNFAGVRADPVTSEQNEYRIKAVLEGKKVVRS